MVSFISPEEKIIYHTITLTWVFYALGALYIVAPAVGWAMLAFLLIRMVMSGSVEGYGIPITILVWIGGMILMEVALIVGHANYDMGVGATIKSTIGWMKGWALLALFPLLGVWMKIRPEVLYRAATNVYVQTLFLVPVFFIAAKIHLPSTIYISPLKAVGGPGPEFFEVQFYGYEGAGHGGAAAGGAPRWRFYSPWAPAAAFVGGVYLTMIINGKNLKRKIQATIGVIAVLFMCQSRMGLIAIPVSIMTAYFISKAAQHKWLGLLAVAVFALGFLAEPLLDLVMLQKEKMEGARSGSTYVRAMLAQIAVERWAAEAPIWGHAVVEPGPKMVEFMPIGSHHSWYGLLYVKGIIGFIALGVPMAFTLGSLLVKSLSSPTARTALGVFFLVSFFTLSENLEILAYLIWPGLLVIGMAAKEPIGNPFAPAPPDKYPPIDWGDNDQKKGFFIGKIEDILNHFTIHKNK